MLACLGVLPIFIPLPNARVVPLPETRDYVAIGEAAIGIPGAYSSPPHYAAGIEADLGVKVNVQVFTAHDMTAYKMPDGLRTAQRWREVLSEAEAMNLVVGHNEVVWVSITAIQAEQCRGDDGMDRVKDNLAGAEEGYDEVLPTVP